MAAQNNHNVAAAPDISDVHTDTVEGVARMQTVLKRWFPETEL